MQQHIQQGIFLEERCRKVLQVFDQAVILLRPVHGKVETVLVAPGGVGKITTVGSVGNDKDLQIFIKRMLAVKALLAIAMNLVKGLANGNTAFFQLYLYQRQAVDQNGNVIAIGMRSGLFKLLNHLHFIAGNMVLVQ